MSTRDEDKKWHDVKVGSIKTYSWPSLSSEAQLRALAMGLNQMTGVIQTILDKVDAIETTVLQIEKVQDKMNNRRWRETNQ